MGKDKLSIVMVGHVDHGKSTLIGRLLYDTNCISNDKIEELKKASVLTDNTLEFAFLLDHLREEREQGITIDTAHTYLRTDNREYQIIDAPGHVEFVRNMITGAAQADSAVLIVDAEEGVKEQTKRHTFILSLIGIKNLIVVINKMDKVNYSKEVYERIVEDIKNLLEKVNMHTDKFIPVSALCGDNVCVPSFNMKWYKSGTLLEIMKKIEVPVDKKNMPAIFQVQEVYKINDNRIAVGKLETGTLHVNEEIKVIQTKQGTKIKSINKFLQDPQYAEAGESIGIMIGDSLYLERGHTLCNEGAKVNLNNKFVASLIWMDEYPIKVNERIIIRCNTQETSCVIKNIRKKVNTGDMKEEEENAEQLSYLNAGEVVIETKNNIAYSKFSDNECMGRFVLVRDNNIGAGGIIR